MDAANILVIEDDEIVARTIERSLRSDDFRVTLAGSGVDGLKVSPPAGSRSDHPGCHHAGDGWIYGLPGNAQ